MQQYAKSVGGEYSFDAKNHLAKVVLSGQKLGLMKHGQRTPITCETTFDSNIMAIIGSKTVEIDEDNNTITTVEKISHQIINGLPVPVLKVTEITNTYGGNLDLTGRRLAPVKNESEIPIISQDELLRLKSDKSVRVFDFDPLIGNRLETKTTIYESHFNIKVNGVSDSEFTMGDQ